MLILNNEKVSVKAEVIIRYDDFTEGLLIKEITFDVTHQVPVTSSNNP